MRIEDSARGLAVPLAPDVWGLCAIQDDRAHGRASAVHPFWCPLDGVDDIHRHRSVCGGYGDDERLSHSHRCLRAGMRVPVQPFLVGRRRWLAQGTQSRRLASSRAREASSHSPLDSSKHLRNCWRCVCCSGNLVLLDALLRTALWKLDGDWNVRRSGRGRGSYREVVTIWCSEVWGRCTSGSEQSCSERIT